MTTGTHRFSESAGLLITKGGHVLNGSWDMSAAQIAAINDWEDVTPSEWPLEKQKAWYYK